MARRISLMAAALVALAPGRAWAPCHLVGFVEVFAGTTDCPRAHYVVLELQADFENFVNGTRVLISTGETFGMFMADVPNGMAGDKVLMATAEAEALFQITADQTAPGVVLIESPDGVVSYDCSGDEVHYGAVPMSESPARAPDVAIRRVGGVWMQGAPAPVNNAGQTGVLGVCPVDDGGVGADGPAMADGSAQTDGPAMADGPAIADGAADSLTRDGPVPTDAPPIDGPAPDSVGVVDAVAADAPADGRAPDAPDAAHAADAAADAADARGDIPPVERPQGCDCHMGGCGSFPALMTILLLLPLTRRRPRRPAGPGLWSMSRTRLSEGERSPRDG